MVKGDEGMLAECPGLGSVSVCVCGSVHVRIGPVELVLEPEAFAQSALMFRQAVEALEAGAARAPDVGSCTGVKTVQRLH